MTILDEIVAYKKDFVAKLKNKMPSSSLFHDGFDETRPFEQQLRHHSPAIIAEVKKASPSKGIICENFQPVEIAKRYQDNKASCLSVLTDEAYFKGCDQYFIDIRQQVDLPMLRKDFIIDEYQIIQSRHIGADCILLIAAILDDQQLHDYNQIAQELNMAVLIESHTQEEIKRAVTINSDLIGINNRNLHNFTTDLNTTVTLKQFVPEGKIVICESGIESMHDIEKMQQHGINTFLIGESLMKAKNNQLT